MNFLQSELDILIYWIRERESIRQKKEAGLPKPWTNDHLLRDYRWCNVRRMDDKVSRELIDWWYRPHGQEDQLVAAALGRLINWPDALRAVTGGKPFQEIHMVFARDRLKRMKATGVKVFTGAYIVYGEPGREKIDSVMDLVCRISENRRQIIGFTMKDTWLELMKLRGLNSFSAGQIVADLSHLWVGAEWPDRKSWAPAGPGSMRGINRLLGRPKDQKIKQAQFEEELRALMKFLFVPIREIWHDRHLRAMDIQNCLCEFDKYRRLTLGEGSVRSSYPGAPQVRFGLQDALRGALEALAANIGARA